MVVWGSYPQPPLSCLVILYFPFTSLFYTTILINRGCEGLIPVHGVVLGALAGFAKVDIHLLQPQPLQQEAQETVQATPA